MYDPHTVAFEIRSPFKTKSAVWPEGYRESLFTIWHRDPERAGTGNRTDDSCGWFRPPTTAEERAHVEKLARDQYGQIFERQVAQCEKRSYAYICFDPSTYDAIYWAWRAIKFDGRKGWQYGNRSPALTARELEAIYSLSANPVDNLRVTVAGITDPDGFIDFFRMVYSAFKRHHRPWYRHPRWHVHHWHIQWHSLQQFNRWAFARCAKCGGRFSWGEPVHGSWGGGSIWHGGCDGVRAAASTSVS